MVEGVTWLGRRGVEAAHLVAPPAQLANQLPTDAAAAARDEHAHGRLTLHAAERQPAPQVALQQGEQREGGDHRDDGRGEHLLDLHHVLPDEGEKA